MRTLSKKLTLSLASMLYILMSGLPLYADDTEIFTGTTTNTLSAQPNILFIIDTSGSMGSNFALTKALYDPATTYPGSCNTSHYYWSAIGNPECTSSQTLEISAFKCEDASLALGANGSGYYNGHFARYFSPTTAGATDYWTTLDATANTIENVECTADYGKFGNGADTTNPYPANETNSGPWRANNATAINWGSTGDAYTIYTANYVNYFNDTSIPPVTLTRLQVVQAVLNDVIDSSANINAALMQFDATLHATNVPHSLGGSFVEAMQKIDNTTRAGFKTTINNLSPYGKTPLSETLYEAMLYFSGKNVLFGNNALPPNVSSVLDPADSSKYKSPILFQCQDNFVVLLTDGTPVADTDADTLIEGASVLNQTCAGDCLDELAEYMFNNDQTANGQSPAFAGDHRISTYTIGFGDIQNFDQTLLQDTARKGGSSGGNVAGFEDIGYFEADSATTLSKAFNAIITDINRVANTFISPAVSVNAFNRLTHNSELYFALFLPTERYRWPGNLKKYKLGRTINNDPTSDLIIVDAVNANQSAVDSATGLFKDNAQSFWSSAADGSDVEKGGAAENLPTTNRNLYTYTGADSNIAAPQTAVQALTNAANKLHESNSILVATGTGEDPTANALLGLPANTSDAERTELIQWARGLDVLDENTNGSTTDYRKSMGDPLHSEPQLVTYKGTDETDADVTIYMITNEGYLHAIDANGDNTPNAGGNELFAFVPKDLLPNLASLKANPSVANRTYGLDGPMTIWHNDLNRDLLVLDASNNPQVTNGVAEHVYLYFGMRRGGKSYYALDVTDRNSPKLKWKIEGGIAGSDFEELGQSWSKMTYAKIKFAGADRDVLIFGGGYDTSADNVTTPAADNMGRAIFIVDAETGQRLWWASIAGSGADLQLADMKNSIAADISAFDSDGDGYVDRIYAADLAARIWRFDIAKDPDAGGAALASLTSGGLIADLNGTAVGTADAANNRHFYAAPSVAYVRDGAQEYFTIAIGSGYRAHPLDTTIEDRFYVLRDTNVRGPAKNASGNPIYTTVTEDELFDTTGNLIGEGASQGVIDAARQSLNTSNGWYIKLSDEFNGDTFIGEKVISKALTFNNIILFSSFTPTSQAAQTNNSCVGSGTSAAWAINLLDGQPVFNFDLTGGRIRKDRKNPLNLLGGLPPSPVIIYPPDGGDPTVFFGTLKLDADVSANKDFQVYFWNIMTN